MASAEESPRKVVIAGGGVAGLEALLALRSLAPERVEVELLCPADEFVYRPLMVAEPFGIELKTRLELAPIVAEAGARHVREALASVDPAERIVTTDAGTKLAYDALLVAPGAAPVEAVPGALTFGGKAELDRFREVLAELGHRGVTRLAFVVPLAATWSIAAYELALLTAAERDARRLQGVELILVTHETSPLELLGVPASQLAAAKLAEAGVELRAGSAARTVEGGELTLDGADPLAVDRVVALPRLEVQKLPGLPQRAHGFIHTDARMQVDGLDHVWAAGDATSFPIKQGGLASQQADVAAHAIAVRAGAHLPAQVFQPVLRAALITGGALEFLRSGGAGIDAGGAAGVGALWWPPTKVAGNYLGPLLARAAGEESPDELTDLAAAAEPEEDEVARQRATEAVLAAADTDARVGDYEDALRWLELIEAVQLVLPPKYVAKRYEWRRELDPGLAPDAIAGRLEPSFVSPEAGISDLERRVGWLRELERGTGGEMGERLLEMQAGIDHLKSLSRQTGVLPKRERRAGR
jgi:sulfide:quinone oxidoreductase